MNFSKYNKRYGFDLAGYLYSHEKGFIRDDHCLMWKNEEVRRNMFIGMCYNYIDKKKFQDEFNICLN